MSLMPSKEGVELRRAASIDVFGDYEHADMWKMFNATGKQIVVQRSDGSRIYYCTIEWLSGHLAENESI